jgi:hypothetical protein
MSSVTHGGFHAKDGWYFERQEDGSVKIRAAVDRSTEVITLPPMEWASVMAALAAAGGTSETFQAARRLHEGGE